MPASCGSRSAHQTWAVSPESSRYLSRSDEMFAHAQGHRHEYGPHATGRPGICDVVMLAWTACEGLSPRSRPCGVWKPKNLTQDTRASQRHHAAPHSRATRAAHRAPSRAAMAAAATGARRGRDRRQKIILLSCRSNRLGAGTGRPARSRGPSQPKFRPSRALTRCQRPAPRNRSAHRRAAGHTCRAGR